MSLALKDALRSIDSMRGHCWRDPGGGDGFPLSESLLLAAQQFVENVYQTLNVLPKRCIIYRKGLLLVKYNQKYPTTYRGPYNLFFTEYVINLEFSGRNHGYYRFNPKDLAALMNMLREIFKSQVGGLRE